MSSSTQPQGPKLELHRVGVAVVVVQKVPPEKVERYLELERGIVQAAQGFAGYQRVDVYPPTARDGVEWVVVLHFDNHASLQGWLDSPVRAEWIARFREEIGEPRLKKLTAGFAPWFVGQLDDHALPPRWKMALAVLLGLYPTVMLLTLLVMPPADRYGLAVTMLVGNLVSVCLLQWVVMPALNGILSPWLRANGPERRGASALGLLLIVLTLIALVYVFSLVS